MKLQSDCIPCILNMTVKSLRKLDFTEPEIKGLLKDILTIPGLDGDTWQRTSPELIEDIMNKLYTVLGNTDPFRDIKKRINAQVLDMSPFAEKMIQSSPEPVQTAAKLAIIGNAIDFMMPGGTQTIKKNIQERLPLMTLPDQPYRQFFNQLSQTGKLVYLTDNCGEIVFDKLFIKTLQQVFKIDVIVVVRGLPTLNDATIKEAYDIGMNDVAQVVENGIDGPFPGTVIKRCSKQVKKYLNNADLIISKGGGNFDSLEEQINSLKTKLTFMLLSKCHPINTYFNTSLNQGIIANFY